MSPFLSLAAVSKPFAWNMSKTTTSLGVEASGLPLIAKAGVRKDTDRSKVDEKQHSARSFFFIFVLRFRYYSGPEEILVAERKMNEIKNGRFLWDYQFSPPLKDEALVCATVHPAPRRVGGWDPQGTAI
jgi:hypothetical protein